MEILGLIGFWLLVLIVLSIIHPLVLGIVSLPFVMIFNFMSAQLSVPIGNFISSIILYGFAYNYLWIYFYSTEAPIFLFVLGLLGAFFGSGNNQIQANEGNKLMTLGEVFGLIALIIYSIFIGVSFF
jgi:hypothetical protein